MRIAVIGAGAMGSLFAARLAAAEQNVSLVEVAGSQIAAIGDHGLRVSEENAENVLRIPIAPAADYSGPFDLLILFTKGMHTKAALEAARHLIGPQTWGMTVQNGVGNVEAMEAAIPRDRIVVGMTNWPSTVLAPGHIQVPGSGEVRIWSASGAPSQRLEDICLALNDAQLNCVLDPSVEVAIWEKVAFNAALNSLAAITDMTVGEMSDRTEARQIAFAILAEALAVAKARGIEVDAERTRRAVEHAFQHHRQHKPSMLQDRLAGRPMEIDTITGAVWREGLMQGVPTPVTAAFTNLLKLFDEPSRSRP